MSVPTEPPDRRRGESDDDSAPTGAAPTELGAAADETEAVTAWSLDDEDDELIVDQPGWSPRRITTAAVAGSLILVAAAGSLALLHRGESLPAVAQTTVVVVPAAEPPPAPKPAPREDFTADVPAARTMKPPPPPPLPKPIPLVEYDRLFLARMQAHGWYIENPALMAHRAHETCAMFRAGEPQSLVYQKMVAQLEISMIGAQQFGSTAMTTYPNCP